MLDVLIFNSTSLGMLCAAEYDPFAAVIMHASIREVEMVFKSGW